MRSAERWKVNVLEMKCLRSLAGVSRMDRVRNEEVCRIAGDRKGVEQSRSESIKSRSESIKMVWACGKNG